MPEAPLPLAKSVAHAGSGWARRWPAPCVVCHGWCTGGLYSACVTRFAAQQPRCARCGLRLAEAGSPCGACSLHGPPMVRTVVALDYAFPWDRLIARFKFAQAPELARVLVQPLIDHLGPQLAAADELRPDLVLPVPLSPRRLRERGYNQAWELARRLARELDLPAQADGLQRWRETPAQTTLDAAARRANLRDAFMVNPQLAGRLAGRHIALADDVMTTGATLAAAADLLLRNGAREVSAWALARTPTPSTGNRPSP